MIQATIQKMPQAIRFHRSGGPEVLTQEEIPLPSPGAGEARVRHTAIGVNFIDIYHRTGLYPLPAYPAIPGVEAAGVVEAVGEGVSAVKTGDRVVYTHHAPGAYATHRVLPVSALVKLPTGISDQDAAASFVKGLTAWYLLTRTYPIRKGDVILFHAAAGGVGLIACQWAAHLGATVIGTAGSEAKAALARAHGCKHVIAYREESVTRRVRELTQGRGVDAVFDSVGKDTFNDSLDSLAPRGMLVSFGQASGKIPPLDVGLLSQKGSLYLTRPTLFHYISDPAEYARGANALFDLLARGVLKLRLHTALPLAKAADAHRLLESRASSGAVVLTV